MAKAVDAALLALLAALEERAKKNGEKSIVKSVVGRLADAGVDDELIAEISALRPKKADRVKLVAETKTPRKVNSETKVGKAKKASPDASLAAS